MSKKQPPVLGIKVILGHYGEDDAYEFTLQVPLMKRMDQPTREDLAKVLVSAIMQGVQHQFPETKI